MLQSSFNYNCSSMCTMKSNAGLNLDANITMKVLYLLIGTLGILGNLIVAGILLKFRHYRKCLTNMFIINQSVLDGTASVFIILSTLLRDIHVFEDSFSKELFCRLWLTNLPIWGLFVSSTYNMVILTFERYFAIVHPMYHRSHCSQRKAFIIITIIWIFGPAFNAAYMIPTAGMDNGECAVYSFWPDNLTQSIVGFLTVTIQYFIPLTLIIYAYICMAVVLSNAFKKRMQYMSNQNNKMDRARKNVIKTLALMSCCFVLCWSWNQIYYTMYNCGFKANFNGNFYHFTVIMVVCNSCINPFVYAVKYDQFQKGFCIVTGCANQCHCFRSKDCNDNSATMSPSNNETLQYNEYKLSEEFKTNHKVEPSVNKDPDTFVSIISDRVLYKTHF